MRWAPLVVLALLWGAMINQLRVEWSLNEQYNYGWFVPLLSAYLFWKAWEHCPPAEQPSRLGMTGWIGGVLLFGLLPTRLMQEANPDWRPVSWLLALLTVGITWCVLYGWGGRRWLKHFAFSAAFILTAVPWPTAIEHPLVQGLMGAVASASVEVLTWMAIPARATGNVISLPGQVIGVDEACSGVRSLQTVIMAGLFLGELQRLGSMRRVILLVGGVGVALLTNILRAIVLVWIVSQVGAEGLAKWHDPVGYGILLLTLGAVWGMAWALTPKFSIPTVVGREKENADGPLLSRPQLLQLAIGVAVWLIVVETLTSQWYRWHERDVIPSRSWTISLPQKKDHFKNLPLSDRVTQLLRASETQSAAWRERDGSVAVYFLRWNPGRNAAQLARLHRPEICLPSAGCFLVRDAGIWRGEVGGLTLPFHAQVFDHAGQPLYVFYCLWEDRVKQGDAEVGEDWTMESRLRAVMQGRRHLGQQVLQLILIGPHDLTQAEETVQRLLPEIVRPD